MLTLQFVPYSDIERLDSSARIRKLLNIVKEEKIVLMQGRLRPEEETGLIEKTMESIRNKFTGIEICTIYPEEVSADLFGRLKKEFYKALIGDREGITVIGPATLIKEIRRDPNKIQLFTSVPVRRTSPRRKVVGGRAKAKKKKR
ncbi:MAG TPA: DUF2073 domain-containing protein [Candidatus Nanoarchaeia archaeon]|nr:DUF2073 domain-containing protein [Candidatus Nanoarchaeia archaeon]